MISITAVVRAILVLAVGGLVFWLLWWGLNRIDPPQPWRKVAEVVLIVGSVLLCIGALLSLVYGVPFLVP